MNRSCTDFFCLIVFLAFIGGLAFVVLYGYQNGNPKKLLAPLDADGHFCGIDVGYEDYKLLYFAKIDTSNWFPSAVCAK